LSQHLHNVHDDSELIRLLKEDPDTAVTSLFEQYYNEVCRHIYRIFPDQAVCNDIAQSIFMELWQKRRRLDIRTSVGAYLHRMAISRTLNFIRDNRRFQHSDEDEGLSVSFGDTNPLDQLIQAELSEAITGATDLLPERCRLVFALSRYEGMSYKEIAAALEISTKTVENQISKALQLLRIALDNYNRGNH
jgi:RNA polymerase sigma-70 factor (ECF subfamily)